MSNKRAYATKVLADIANDPAQSASDRINAAQQLAEMDDYLGPPRWYQVKTRDLAIFFLKVVLAGAPAMLLTMFLYIAVAIFTQVAPVIMGLQ